MNEIPKAVRKSIQTMQKGEITEHFVYLNIAKNMKNPENKKILINIANQEKAHYEIWTKYLGEPATPNKFRIAWFTFLSRLLGYTFALKLMEKGEDAAKNTYEEIAKHIGEEATKIAQEEHIHETELISMLDEERLNYVGSMVLGLNDALVELTGALAGLTLALQSRTDLISLSGLITGIAASFSMAASQYLSAKADNNPNALKSALYTGVAYIITVAILIAPYLLIKNQPFVSLGTMLGCAVLIIFFFNYYISVAKGYNFKKRFFSMASISLGVAAFSFGIGFLVKLVLHIDV